MVVKFRPRTVEDDRRSISRRETASRPKDSIYSIPEPTKAPIVSWERPIDSLGQPVEHDPDDETLKCVNWPMSTEILCHHCCHSFKGVPVPLPQSYDALRKVYHCRGNFCSWQCAKAHNTFQTPPSGRGNRNMYISLLAHRTWVKYRGHRQERKTSGMMKTYAMSSIHPAPPKEVLQTFGGDMTIEKYRQGSFGIIPPSEAAMGKPFLTLRQRLKLPFADAANRTPENSASREKLATQKIETSRVHRHSNAFCDKLNKAKTDRSIMKRKRAVATKNTLMSTMGVVIETKKR